MEFEVQDIENYIKKCKDNLTIDSLTKLIRGIKAHNLSGYTELIAQLGIEAFAKYSALQKVDYFDVMEEVYFSCLTLKIQDWSFYFL